MTAPPRLCRSSRGDHHMREPLCRFLLRNAPKTHARASRMGPLRANAVHKS